MSGTSGTLWDLIFTGFLLCLHSLPRAWSRGAFYILLYLQIPVSAIVWEKWSVLTLLKNYAQLELQVRTCGLRSADARLDFKLGAA